MLKRVRISGYRSCVDVTLDELGGLTALVGRNSAGKTNVLRGIEWLARIAVVAGPNSWEVERLEKPFAGEAWIDLDGQTYRYECRVPAVIEPTDLAAGREERLWAVEGDGAELLFERKGDTITSPLLTSPLQVGKAPALFALFGFLPKSNELRKPALSVATFLGGVRYYPFTDADEYELGSDLMIRQADLDKWRAHGPSGRHTSSEVATELVDLSQSDPERFDEFVRAASEDGLGLVQGLTVRRWGKGGPFGEVFTPLFHTAHDPGPMNGFTVSQLSQGTRRLLRLLLAAVNDDATVMLVEHPEDCVHRGLLPKVIGLLQSAFCAGQVVLTTHSAAIVDALSPQDVRLVHAQDGGTAVRPLDGKELALCQKYVESDEGVSLSDFVRSVVEG